MNQKLLFRRIVPALLTGLLLCPQPETAHAETINWNNPAGGVYGLPTNWLGGTPSASSDIIFNLGAISAYTVNVLTPGAAHSISVDSGAVTMVIAPGQSLTLGGPIAVNSSATLLLTGDTTSILAIGGANAITGTLSVAGTTLRATSDLTSSATLNLVAATGMGLDTNGHSVTWSGNIAGSAAALGKTGAGTLTFDGTGTRTIGTFVANGGSTVQSAGVTTSAEFLVGSGTTSGVPNVGSYTLDAGDILIQGQPPFDAPGASASMRVGDFGGTGTFTQNGGSLTITSNSALNIGNQGGTGTYNLTGGTLTLLNGNNVLGRSSGSNPSSSGTLNVSGGLLEVKDTAALIIGNNIAGAAVGTGVVNQTGGIVRVANNSNLYISGHTSANGTYNLKGGTLEIGGNSLHSRYNNTTSTYAFNLSGGTIKVLDTNLLAALNANLIGSGVKGTKWVSKIDTNGVGATWSGNLLATGLHTVDEGGSSLEKTGAGTLRLTGATRTLDTFVVTGGTAQQTAGATTAGEFMVGSGKTSNVANVGEFLMDGGTLTINPTTTAAGAAQSGSFRVGDFGGIGTFTQTAGTVTVSANSALNIGNQGGTGTYNLNGGTLNFQGGNNVLGRSTGANPSSSGTLNVNGGLLDIEDGAALIIGNNTSGTAAFGTGVVNHNSGTVRVANDSSLFISGHVNSSGSYNLSGGTLEIGGSSLQARYNNATSAYAFNLRGGTIKVLDTNLIAALNANLVGSGVKGTKWVSKIDTNGIGATWSGNLTADGLHTVDEGGSSLEKTGAGTLRLTGTTRTLDTFAVTGGTAQQTAGATTAVEFMVGTGKTSNVANVGEFLMEGGTLAINPSTTAAGAAQSGSFRIGDFGGIGTFTQTAGTVTVTPNSALNIGNQGGTGTYNLNGGTLNLQGGINVLGRSAGANPSSTGTLNVTAGLLDIEDSASLIIGNNMSGGPLGTGTVNQSGGTVRVANDSALFLSGFTNSSGTYNLSGGTLEIGGNSLRARYNNSTSAYAFNLGGGTLRVLDTDLITDVNANLVGTNKKSTLDTNGKNATWSGNFSAAGQHQMDNGGTSFEKIGTGKLTLSGATRTFDTFVANGDVTEQTTGNTTAVEFMVGSGTGATATFEMDGGTLGINPSLASNNTTVVAGSFRIGDFGGTGTFNQTAGTVSIDGSMNIGNQGGHGTYNLSGGTLNLIEDGQSTLGRTSGANASYGGSTGALNISGTGVLNVSDTAKLVLSNWYPNTGQVQGTGILTQSGGTVAVASGAELILTGHGHGIYNLDGGELQIGGNSLRAIYGGESGTYAFNLRGGKIKVTGSDLDTDVNTTVAGVNKKSTIDTNGQDASWSGNIASAGTHQNGNGGSELEKTGLGTLVWDGATRSLETFAVRGGTTQQAAGDTTAVEFMVGSGLGNTGSYLMDGGTLTVNSSFDDDGTTPVAGSFRIGDFGGTGTFTQTAGTVTVNQVGALNIGNQGGTGIYDLQAGILNLQGGINVLGRSTGANPASTGTLYVKGGQVNLKQNSSLILGNNQLGAALGTGLVTQTGGTFRVENDSKLFLSGFGNGTYNLNGGALEIGGSSSLYARYNNSTSTYAFNLGGGTLRVIGSDLDTDVNANVGGVNKKSTIDTNGFDATWSGNLSSAGTHQNGNGGSELEKTGLGTLVWSGTTRSLETFAVRGGTTQQTAGATTAVEFMVGSGQTGSVANVGEYLMDGGSLEVKPSLDDDGTTPVAGSFRVGDFGGTGTFTQTAGTVTLTGNSGLNIGNRGGHGTYNISAGTLHLSDSLNIIGRNDTGDGTASAPTLGSSEGELNISGTALVELESGGSLILSSNAETTIASVGQGSKGTINQTGGTFRVASDASLFLGADGTGTYNLDGGVLEIGGDSLKGVYNNLGGSYAFNVGGGKIKVTGSDLNTGVKVSLKANTSSVIDTGSFNATINNGIAGLGNLQKTGTGSLTVNGESSVGTLLLTDGVTTFHRSLTASSIVVETGADLHLEGLVNTATGDVTVAVGSELKGAIAAAGETSIAGTHDLGTESIVSTGDYLLEGNATLKFDLTGTDFNTARLAYAHITLADNATLLLTYSGVINEFDRIFLFQASNELTIGTTVNIQGQGSLSPYILTLGDDGYITVTAVPEPSIVALLAAAALATITLARRRQAKLP